MLLVHHFAVGIAEDTGIVGRVAQFETSVVGELLCTERQVGDKSHLFPRRSHIAEILDTAVRQRLLVENKVVNVSRESVSGLCDTIAESVG